MSSTKRRKAARRLPGPKNTSTSPIDPFRQITELALSSARMCGWDWDMVTGADTFYGDTAAIFGAEPGTTYEALRQRIHPDDLPQVEKDLAAASENHSDYDGEFRVVHPDGAIRWIHGRGRFYYEDGKPVRMLGVNVDVTAQKSRERELADAKASLQAQKAVIQTVADHIPIMLCYMRQPGKVEWVNRAWEEALGWTAEDNNGELASVLYPDAAEAARVRAFIAEASGEWKEFNLRTKAGSTLQAEFMNVNLPDGANIGVGRDLTVEKRTIHELIESGRRFRMLSENIPQLVWISDAQGRTRYYNQRWFEFTGQTAAQASDYGWRQVMHPDDLEPNRILWEEATRRSVPFENELRLRRHDGLFRWFLVRATPILNSRGQLERWFGTSTEITDQKQTEERLRRSEARYRTLVEASAQMVWSSNGAGDSFGSLDGWEAFTGQTPEEARNGGWVAVVHPDDAAASLEAWNRAVKTRSVFHHEHRVRRRDGAYRLMVSRAVPVLDDAGNIAEWIGTKTDITDQKLAEQALIRAEKLATAGRFAATVAHEVNNPLTAVTNIHFILAGDQTLPENVRAYLSLADAELHRVSHILRQTLAFYREHSRTQEIKVATLVDEVAGIFRHRLESRAIGFESRIPADLALSTMAGELRQILSNLVANALDACTKGSRILLRAHACSSARAADRVRIVVADSGTGIPAENRERLFEPFFTTKENLGTGLGLWVTRQLAERNHGRIRVRSRAGAGTVFVLDFPVEGSSPAAVPVSAEDVIHLARTSQPAASPGNGSVREPEQVAAAHLGAAELPLPATLTVPIQ